jgi:hypothetical protein
MKGTQAEGVSGSALALPLLLAREVSAVFRQRFDIRRSDTSGVGGHGNLAFGGINPVAGRAAQGRLRRRRSLEYFQ